jgi:glycosyltransferase involved in cell wall biosynthesis
MSMAVYSHQLSLSVVIPMYNEAENVAPMIAGVHQGLASYPGAWELICVDDGSHDDTPQRLCAAARAAGDYVRVIRLRRNCGQTAAMQTGIEAARGEIIATLDGDLQNDPADIPRMVEEMLARDLANWLIAKITQVRISDYGCSLKIYRSEVIKEVRLYGEMHRFIPVWVANVTAPSRIGETVVNHRARQFGTSKYGLSRTFRVILDLLAAFFFLRYRARPGHFFGSIGLLLGSIGGLAMSWLMVVKFVFGEDIGNRPLLFIGILMLLASAQFLTTGVLAEMLSRTLFASSDKPTYALISGGEPSEQGWKQPT